MKITPRLLIGLGFRNKGKGLFEFQMRVGTVSCCFEKDGRIKVVMPDGFVHVHICTAEGLFHDTCTNCFQFGKKGATKRIVQFAEANL